ncbi:helix-turn-helix domain-containing protein [Halobacillus salinarum]|uniref:Helix-turn-helix domain-containing protein n=1 Tax=Halobacillus salinarum TaxID=2932257 RepID=A0ABY4EGE2_9BACI|nr:helix-turn-helix domain-containing protein [Halobacillus salinarum]UOQ43530.1 helix-turn-helix domain-containing protein [Halobacillus salinarum]
MSIINQLKELYPSLITSLPGSEDYNPDYHWYFTPDETEIVGILKSDVTKREASLLQSFLTPFYPAATEKNPREEAWNDILSGNEISVSFSPPSQYRFIFFNLEDATIQRETIREALQSFFPYSMPILWTAEQSGCIIEEFEEESELIAVHDIVDVIMSDFYTKISFYISEISENIEEAPAIYKWSQNCFERARKYHLGTVVTFQEIIPYLFINYLPEEDCSNVIRALFKHVKGDKELLHTIKVYLESGSNTTLAAKQLFMHRNSLQYRVDKFIEKTGVDVKQFKGALTTYLALMRLEE